MAHGPVTLSRRHVLGDLYARCQRLDSVPVYLNDENGERLGFVDESHGIYADAFTFHISEEYCKKLAEGQLLYSFRYDLANKGRTASVADKRAIKLSSIILTMRKGYTKPVPKSERDAAAKALAAATESEAVTAKK